jgi:phage/plasmid-like protein (TIGR03299 family)
MISLTVDVNEAFRTEKLGQIAMAHAVVERSRQAQADYDSGKTQADLDAALAAKVAAGDIRLIGSDRYMVLTGYDANETFRIQRARKPQELPLVLPETGLDYVDGKAQLFTAAPAWHEEGNVVQGVTDVEEVLRLGGLNFLVEKTPAFYYAGGEIREAPGSFITYRGDTFAKLGAVGKLYTPFQNIEGATFLQELSDRFDVQFESAGPLDGGKKVFISMKLPESVRIDAEGINDEVVPYIAWLNDHEGEGKLKVVCTPWCPRCANTNRFALRDAITSWGVRHTTNGLQRLEEARRTLNLSVKYFEKFAAEETQLARIDFEVDQFAALLEELWPTAEAEKLSKRQKTALATREEALFERFAVDSKRLGRTAYAAEQAVTDYLDHAAPRRVQKTMLADARATAALLGSDDDVKAKAHRQLMTLTNR